MGQTPPFISGLNTIHELTKDGDYEMRVDMEDFENETRYAYYRYPSKIDLSTYILGDTKRMSQL